jgi:phasin family protein
MFNVVEQLAEINKANVAQVAKVAALAIENTEKLAKMNVLGAKSSLAQAVGGAQAMATVKAPQEFFALRAKLAETSAEAALNYTKGLYDLLAEAQAQYSALAEEAWAAYTKSLAAWIEKAGSSAPAGTEVAVSAVKSTFAASTAAIDQFNKATKQVVSLADASVRAAASNATKANAVAKARKSA